ncbi:MAG TPA: pH regulation protein F [Ignisphaera sp.]|nr:pH regulation protein F [Ignisphaera sp.]
MDLETWVTNFIMIAMFLYIAAFLLYTVRIFKGPTVPDMVLAVDALSYDLAAFLVVLSILFRSPIMIPSALVLVLWAYALDIYIAKYLEAREMGE